MKKISINLDQYQSLSRNLPKKLQLLKQQKIISVIGPLLKTLPEFQAGNLCLQVDCTYLNNNQPSIILGDADSAPENSQHFFDYLFPQDKNFTDFEALLYLLSTQPNLQELHLYGFWGGRFDHMHLIACQITELLLQHTHIQTVWLYDETNTKIFGIFNCGIHAFNEQISFSIISPATQNIVLAGEIQYSGKIHLNSWSGQGISNISTGNWSLECRLPIWKYILSNGSKTHL